ncbi:MAG: replication-relaxation family protein [Solirubrobacterales bacterium]
MTRLSRKGLLLLADDLSVRDRQVVELVARFGVASGKQVDRLFFAAGADPESNARLARRLLARLVERRVLLRLERRVGGVRAGSAGAVYRLGTVGDRLLRFWRGDGGRGRAAREPGRLFVRHGLAITETYVRLREAEREGKLELLAFHPEPASWRPFAGAGGRQVLKPDAHTRIGLGKSEDHYFLELDCGTEGRGALAAKCRTYVAYFRSGIEQAEHGVFPRVVWITTSEQRVALIVNVCASLPAAVWPLFAVTTPERAEGLFLGRLDPSEVAPGRAS